MIKQKGTMTTKKCTKCNEVKSVNEFYKENNCNQIVFKTNEYPSLPSEVIHK